MVLVILSFGQDFTYIHLCSNVLLVTAVQKRNVAVKLLRNCRTQRLHMADCCFDRVRACSQIAANYTAPAALLGNQPGNATPELDYTLFE